MFVIFAKNANKSSECIQLTNTNISCSCICLPTQNLAYVGIVHVGESLEDLAPLIFGPHHERVHWSFNVGLVVVSSSGFPEDSRLGRSSASCWPTIIRVGFYLWSH